MSGREWAPGDVALDPDYPGNVAFVVDYGPFRCSENHRNARIHVHYSDGDWNTGVVLGRLRPLLTLDPESDDDAHRLVRAFWDHHNDDCDDDRSMRDAMRSLVAPPEPPKQTCRASLIVCGEFFWCDQTEGHGMAHGNTKAEAIWGESA
jgi:hypothetical protein